VNSQMQPVELFVTFGKSTTGFNTYTTVSYSSTSPTEVQWSDTAMPGGSLADFLLRILHPCNSWNLENSPASKFLGASRAPCMA